MLNNKYRVHEVAKDFKKNSKEITDILTKYATAPKNHMQVLEDPDDMVKKEDAPVKADSVPHKSNPDRDVL